MLKEKVTFKQWTRYDVFGPGDETLAAGTNGVSGATDYQRYDDSQLLDMFLMVLVLLTDRLLV